MTSFLIDVNLPRYFSLWEDEAYIFVADIDPICTDSHIWNHAVANNFTIVSKDADFSDRVLVAASAPSVIHIRTGNMKMREFHTFLTGIWSEVCQLSEKHHLVQVYRDRIETID